MAIVESTAFSTGGAASKGLTIAIAPEGTADTANVTISVVDPAGAAVAEPTMIAVWLSDLADGTGGSAHTHSTGPAFTTGAIQQIMIANDAWIVLTAATGVAVLKLVDTANENVTINAQVLGGSGKRVSDTTVAADWDPA